MQVTFNVQPSRVRRILLQPLGLVERDVRRRVRRVETAARRMAPGSMGQGQRIKGRVERGPEGYRGVVTSTHPASIYVIKGTRPHVIRPRRAKALRFRVGGRTVFARVVNHPGTKPNDFLSKALREAV
ncbi:hypothetical protein QNO07_09280 [Streptomyces sp. 549]|uniref:hypothetical protein n=1 Tax=Streptomyces sp. 549 TaxID=3049076 RepID=UPI0024C2898E|nr:hypothetical protein [Streptomyces sp. 549]MDK1473610.1 hypothetical protein [Streptomyces sp. 549]